MKPTINQLKNINPILVWRSEKEIEKIVFYLEEKGFFWIESRKVFYNKELEITVNPKELERVMEDNNKLELEIKRAREDRRNKKEEQIGDIRVAGFFIHFLVFLIIMNLFLGWIFLNIIFWIFLEIFFILILTAFIKIRNKIKKHAC